jgi:hypothetical protein
MREHRIPTHGDYARHLRGDRTIEFVAAEAGVTDRVVSQIESGEGSIEDRIRKVAGFYGVEFEELLAGSTESPPARPEPASPMDGTVVLNIEIHGGRREAVAITFGLEQAANTHFRINLRDFRTGSLILELQVDRSDFWRLIDAFGDGRFDDFNFESITFAPFSTLFLVTGAASLVITAAFVWWIPPIATAALAAAMARLRSKIPKTLTVDIKRQGIVITKRRPDHTVESPKREPLLTG